MTGGPLQNVFSTGVLVGASVMVGPRLGVKSGGAAVQVAGKLQVEVDMAMAGPSGACQRVV